MTQKTDPVHSPEAAELLKDPARLKALMQSPETRQLMQLLSSRNGSGLRQAAEQAKKGNSSALSEMLRQVTDSREGADLIGRLQSKMEK